MKAAHWGPLHPLDLFLLTNFVQSNEAFKRHSESFSPVCLPHLSSAAFMHAYIAFLDVEASVCLVLLSGSADTFFQLLESRGQIQRELVHSNVLQHIRSVVLGPRGGRPGMETLLHTMLRSTAASGGSGMLSGLFGGSASSDSRQASSSSTQQGVVADWLAPLGHAGGFFTRSYYTAGPASPTASATSEGGPPPPLNGGSNSSKAAAAGTAHDSDEASPANQAGIVLDPHNWQRHVLAQVIDSPNTLDASCLPRHQRKQRQRAGTATSSGTTSPGSRSPAPSHLRSFSGTSLGTAADGDSPAAAAGSTASAFAGPSTSWVAGTLPPADAASSSALSSSEPALSPSTSSQGLAASGPASGKVGSTASASNGSIAKVNDLVARSGLVHFMVKIPAKRQVIMPAFAGPVSHRKQRKRIIRAYARLHCFAFLDYDDANGKPNKVSWMANSELATMAVVGGSVEVYLAFQGQVDKSAAALLADSLKTAFSDKSRIAHLLVA